MATTIAKYIYTIDSSRRSNGTITDFNITLSQPVQRQAKGSQFTVRVVSTTIPFSFYQLSSEHNTLQVIFSDGTNTKNSTITLTPGNYTTSSIANLLASILTTECQISSGSFVGYNPQLTFTYSSVTGQDTFIMTASPGSITLRFDLNLTLGLFFGFSTSIVVSAAAPQISAKTAVANPVNRLYIRSGDLSQYRNREWIVETDAFSDILYHVPITTNQNTFIHWNETQENVIITNDTITTFNIYLSTNLSYTPIDLRGLDWSLTMYIEEVIPPRYDPIKPTILELPLQKNPMEEELLKLRDEALKKVDKYKQKLLKKIPDKNLLTTIKDALLSKQSTAEGISDQLETEEPK
jgi:hypothetical protein